MALSPVLYDFEIALSQVDRGLEEKLTVKTARHPSEELSRVWLRVLAYCWQYQERIAFGPGLGDPEAPDCEALDLTGRRTLWLRVGKAEPGKIQRAADRNPDAHVVVLFDSPTRLEAFLTAARDEKVARLDRVELAAADPGLLAALGAVEERRSRLSLTFVGDHFYVDRAGRSVDGPLTRGRADG